MPDSGQAEQITNVWHAWPKGERVRCTSGNFWLYHGEICICSCAWCVEHKRNPEAVSSCCPSVHD